MDGIVSRKSRRPTAKPCCFTSDPGARGTGRRSYDSAPVTPLESALGSYCFRCVCAPAAHYERLHVTRYPTGTFVTLARKMGALRDRWSRSSGIRSAKDSDLVAYSSGPHGITSGLLIQHVRRLLESTSGYKTLLPLLSEHELGCGSGLDKW